LIRSPFFGAWAASDSSTIVALVKFQNLSGAAFDGLGDTAAIDRFATQASDANIQELVGSIRLSTAELQSQIRAVVARLRPVGLSEFGIAKAVENLLDFWRRRHPEVEFSLAVALEREGYGDLLDVTTFRIVQEGLSNALRHGQPRHVAVSIRYDDAPKPALRVEVTDDGQCVGEIEPGFGLTGMGERVRAAGGALEIRRKPPHGFFVGATLPLSLANGRPAA
jgi:two-component system sensor histidine kinase UhpB